MMRKHIKSISLVIGIVISVVYPLLIKPIVLNPQDTEVIVDYASSTKLAIFYSIVWFVLWLIFLVLIPSAVAKFKKE